MATGLNDTQVEALSLLLAAMTVAGEETLPGGLTTNAFGMDLRPSSRMPPGFYAESQLSQVPGGAYERRGDEEWAEGETQKYGGGKRKQRGGGACEDNRFLSLAIDATILLAFAGTGFVGGRAFGVILDYYIREYNLVGVPQAVMGELYELISVFKTEGAKSGSAIYSALAQVADSTATSGAATGAAVFKMGSAVAPAAAIAAPAFLAGRYFRTGVEMRNDINSTIEAIQAQIGQIDAGRVTRSLAAKKGELMEQLTAAKAAADAGTARATSAASSTGAVIVGGYKTFKQGICATIDRVLGAASRAQVATSSAVSSAMAVVPSKEQILTALEQTFEGFGTAQAAHDPMNVLGRYGGKQRRTRKLRKHRKHKKSHKGGKKSSKRRSNKRR
jgi:hypothetical protein